MPQVTNLLILLLVLLPTLAQSQRIPASSDAAQGELVIEPAKEDWVTLTSTAFFSKPTTLIEHREIAKLRGILSTRWTTLKAGKEFVEKDRLKEMCQNIQQSYSATKNHTVVLAKVIWRKLPYCRITVHEKDGLTIDQLLFVARGVKKNRSYITHTVTFFYPAADEDRATKEVVKFVGSVSRRTDG